MSKQIIIIDSAEALAKKIEGVLGLEGKSYVIPSIAACLHSIEVPSDAGELVKKLRTKSWITTRSFPYQDFTFSFDEAVVLITAHSRTVPREMLEELWTASWGSGGRGQVIGGKDSAIEKIAAKYGYHAK